LNLAKYRKAQHDLEDAEERLAASAEVNARNRLKRTTATNRNVRINVCLYL